MAPYDAASAKGLLQAAIRDPNPVIFLENEMLYGKSFDVPETIPVPTLDKSIVRRPGEDVTLVGFSLMVDVCLQAAEQLAQEGISAQVIDLCVLRPWDTRTIIESVQHTHRIVSVEEGWPICGIGSEVIAHVIEHAFDALDAPPERVAGLDTPLSYAANQERMSLPHVQQVVDAARRTLFHQ